MTQGPSMPMFQNEEQAAIFSTQISFYRLCYLESYKISTMSFTASTEHCAAREQMIINPHKTTKEHKLSDHK